MGMPVKEALRRYPGATVFRFGVENVANAQLLHMVRAGRKTVRCDAVDNYKKREEVLPVAGGFGIALYNHGLPALAIQTEAVSLIPFDQMTDDLIPPQGSFADLAHWREVFEADLTEAGVFAPDVMMVVERFEVVELF